ncbi:urease accessory protein UreF [Gordonia neofelifaecis]|uniref:Urease accessory protein UreF n=1 Tax=Gordonia neofelifaecis NRRL B-59395 TaxID=644548 RepID=F1YNE1_9ACTN|nr:urease accessory protein UreF [Gordonia neofelifaecis]EGD53852.1 urease accessory protein UreF [Gordonia neofelifaecis NRRL B-59395]
MGASPAYLLPLLQLSDSALPTGGFSHSFGMETYLATGVVHDEVTFAQWLHVYIARQLTCCDGLAIRFAYEALDGGRGVDELVRLDRELAAQALPRQVRTAASTMGRRMADIGETVCDSEVLARYRAAIDDGRAAGHPALAYAVVAHASGAPADAAIEAFLFATASSLTQNAVRGIPIGQNAGQRVQRGVYPVIATAVVETRRLTRDDLGAVAPGLEIAQMRHERQRARMFMS